MTNITFKPAKCYLIKLYLRTLFVQGFFFVIALSFIFGSEQMSIFQFMSNSVPLMILGGVQIIIWLLVTLYYFSFRYEIHDDEIVVRSGILVRKITHVPFRTITNISTKRDIIDQLIGLGTLDIQTAGTGGTAPEISLAGVTNVAVLYEEVAQILRRFRSGMSPTQADSETNQVSTNQVLIAILQEVRALRRELNGA